LVERRLARPRLVNRKAARRHRRVGPSGKAETEGRVHGAGDLRREGLRRDPGLGERSAGAVDVFADGDGTSAEKKTERDSEPKHDLQSRKPPGRGCSSACRAPPSLKPVTLRSHTAPKDPGRA